MTDAKMELCCNLEQGEFLLYYEQISPQGAPSFIFPIWQGFTSGRDPKAVTHSLETLFNIQHWGPPPPNGIDCSEKGSEPLAHEIRFMGGSIWLYEKVWKSLGLPYTKEETIIRRFLKKEISFSQLRDGYNTS